MYFGRRVLIFASSTVLAVTLAGCGSSSSDDGKPQVVAAFYPLAYAAERVAGDNADVTNLTSPGVEPHDLEATPRDVADIANADLVLILQGFQPAIDEAAEQNAEGEVMDAGEVVDLLPAHPEGEQEGEDEAGHDHGEFDPHFWQDPTRMATLADSIADNLSELDPDNATEYAANAASLRSDLETLDSDFTTGLAGCERDTIVVSHDAFEYLGKYDLQIESIVGLSPGAEPTPGDLSRLRDLIQTEGVTTVFSETLVSPELAETLASEAGVTTAVLDPIEGLSDQTSGEDYLSLMRSNLAALREANGC